jgi:hypothetical protein
MHHPFSSKKSSHKKAQKQARKIKVSTIKIDQAKTL